MSALVAKFTREERNMTVWQRLRAACEAELSEAFADDEKDGITRALYQYVLRERKDAALTNHNEQE